MHSTYSQRLQLLQQSDINPLLRECLHGIERESLRVTPTGNLALTGHPTALGSSLTHASITTDYAEPLLEFITRAHADSAATLDELEQIHRFTHSVLDNELLWSPSMPCRLPAEADIPIARFGNSTTGRFKYLYRLGLALRYGKTMQCIAGIHYNFSLPESLWKRLQEAEGNTQPLQDYQSERYIALTRNFRRYSWLLMYLFGASPAVDASFVRDIPHHTLERFDDETYYLPWATSLRMSDLGYQSNAQAGITPCYNNLQNYTDSLLKAVSTPYPGYVALGTHDASGQWQQINTNVLQIENEYYSTIRPKRITLGNERPVEALIQRGIQYVEARCVDINPFLPLGIDLEQARFMDSFLLYCALEDSPLFAGDDCPQIRQNFLDVVNRGRQPGLQLINDSGQQVALTDWGQQLLDSIQPCAELLDQAYGIHEHVRSLSPQRARLNDPGLTPSARLLDAMRQRNCSFADMALQLSREHSEQLRTPPLDKASLAYYRQLAEESIAAQQAIEAEPQMDFDHYMEQYLVR